MPSSAAQKAGIVGQPAPSWEVGQWLNLPAGESELDVADFRGKVLYVFCFQSWCPGCHSSGFPTLQRMISAYAGNEDVAFVAIQTVFEGFSSNTFADARRTAKEYKLQIPVGHSGEHGKPSPMMRRYRTGGTPWTMIIDRRGVVRFNDFHVRTDQARALIDRLLADAAPPAGEARKELPRSRSGQSLIGKRLKLDGVQWIGKEVPLKGQVTLVRWWTDSCPYCAASLPAISGLQQKFKGRGFQTIGVYHPKPPREVDAAEITAKAKRLQYAGPLAADLDWRVLHANYLSDHPYSPTSVSFLLDKKAVVRYVHPGPVFHPTDDPDKKQANQDYEEIAKAIELLTEE